MKILSTKIKNRFLINFINLDKKLVDIIKTIPYNLLILIFLYEIIPG